MSASLVGSEMCIRDSFKDLFHLIDTVARARGPARLTEVMAWGRTTPLACLLYTSDAADDM
eukprot:12227104-Alexandrium_andersonii.AAC.1